MSCVDSLTFLPSLLISAVKYLADFSSPTTVHQGPALCYYWFYPFLSSQNLVSQQRKERREMERKFCLLVPLLLNQ